jgi:hypothetical protein
VRERAYVDYYRRHGKTYHVKAQRESIALKGKPIPARAALVEAMFMAELKSLPPGTHRLDRFLAHGETTTSLINATPIARRDPPLDDD